MADLDPADFALFGEWLAGKVNGCTCAGGTPESSYLHEPHCGWEPLITLSQVQELNQQRQAALDLCTQSMAVHLASPFVLSILAALGENPDQ
jgi:hypothetical protein